MFCADSVFYDDCFSSGGIRFLFGYPYEGTDCLAIDRLHVAGW